MRLRISETGEDLRWLPPKFVITNDRGEAKLALAPSTYQIRRTTSDIAGFSVSKSTWTDLELMLDPGFTVKGVVVDSSDHPVSGAKVFCHREPLYENGDQVAITDGEGRFVVHHAVYPTYFWASVGSTAPSKRIDPGVRGGEVFLKLVVGGTAATVSGRVLNRAGRPVQGARVQVGHPYGKWVREADGTTVMSSPSRVVRTDRLGRFEAPGMAPRHYKLWVITDGYPTLLDEVDVTPGATTAIDLVLEHGFAVECHSSGYLVHP